MNSALRLRRKRGSPISHDPAAVRSAREEAGLQQQQLARLVGISNQLMCDIENGRRSATPPVLKLIAQHTASKVADLKRRTDAASAR